MRFVITGEWDRNRLLQVIVVLYALYVALLWVTNAMLYFQKMTLAPSSVVAYYLGDEANYLPARSLQGLTEVSHFHLFAVGMLLLVLTHLMLFIPVRSSLKAWLIAVPFLSGLLDEGAGWLVRFGGPEFAIVKVAGFLMLQTSLAVLVIISLWSVLTPHQAENYVGLDDDFPEDEFEDD
ncbi:MAG: hypothetical protein P8M78_08040 [Myxococcota bacterium]|nr:hypothetical protein [Myxococcota bacterium]